MKKSQTPWRLRGTQLLRTGLTTAAVLVAGCVLAPDKAQPLPAIAFADAHFQPIETPISVDEVFAMTPAMKRYAEDELRPQMNVPYPAMALMEALRQQGQLKLEYDASRTRSAGEAFAARTGNCLSLLIMTAAFADYFGLPVRFQEVLTDTAWSRSGTVAFANKHVNLRLSNRDDRWTVIPGQSPEDEGMTVDFLPSVAVRGYRTERIDKADVISMFLSNRAAERLADGAIDEAYWWARASVRFNPAFADAYNTLGVIYRQHGDLIEAESALKSLLQREPENELALSNLAGVLRQQGRLPEASAIERQVAALDPYPPFYFLDQGVLALRAGRYQAARELLQRELSRAPYDADAHFWLGIANLQLGKVAQARRQIQTAVDGSTSAQTRQIYSAKLEWLKQQGYETGTSKTGL